MNGVTAIPIPICVVSVRVLKVIDAPWFKIIDGTGVFSTPSAKLLRNRRFRSDYLGHAQRAGYRKAGDCDRQD